MDFDSIVITEGWLKKKLSLKKIIEEFPDDNYMILCCNKQQDSGESVNIFLYIPQQNNYGLSVGDTFDYVVSSNGRYKTYGICTVQNIININYKNVKEVKITNINNIGMDNKEKRKLYTTLKIF